MSEKTTKAKRNKKDSQLLIRISTEERERFVELCEELDTSAAREIRHFIRGFIKQHEPMKAQEKETIDVEENQSRR